MGRMGSVPRSVRAILAIAVTSLSLCGVAVGARAGDASAGACRDKANGSDAIVDCEKGELRGVEARLKESYHNAMTPLPADQKAKLLRAERRWIAFRAADCSIYYGKQIGTAVARMQANDCMISHARLRIRQLDVHQALIGSALSGARRRAGAQAR